MGSERGVQPLSRCGVGGVQRQGGGDSKHPSLPLAQRSVTDGEEFYKIP